jgi:delta 1-pyrroline-5-carboxylate dehydrogenase
VTLLQKQILFAMLVSHLIEKATSSGYGLTFGEAWRSDETAKLDAQDGKGIVNSVHRIRLAVDFNLFKNGVLLTSVEDYRPLGEYWESCSDANGAYTCCWGGRFNDADHFSISHNGVK